ncbi:MAG TPA: hypothetical protein VK666_19620 [Chryseolinea sp.]|nr:hypothetical protein [Chryseolinea sp.]
MSPLKKIERKGNAAVRNLRRQKLRDGLPFMINSGELLAGQCYLEYPDGIIKLVEIEKESRDFQIIRELSATETERLRLHYRFD